MYKNMRGGNSTSHSAEYYGGTSDKYFETPPIAGGSAYGPIRSSSFGHIEGGYTGPNLAVYPNGNLIQTGGTNCGYRKPQNGGNGCPYRKPQNGGTSCGNHSLKNTHQNGGRFGKKKKSRRRKKKRLVSSRSRNKSRTKRY